MALITADDYKTWKGISTSDYDARIAVYIDQVQAFADKYTGRTLERQAGIVEYVDGKGGMYLFLKNSPIETITSIAHVADDGTETTMPATTYDYATSEDSRSSVCRKGYSVADACWGGQCQGRPMWQRGCRNWKVTYTAGYAAGSAPADLERALFRLIDALFDETERDVGVGDIQSEALGAYNYTLMSYVDRTESMRALLRPYKRVQ